MTNQKTGRVPTSERVTGVLMILIAIVTPVALIATTSPLAGWQISLTLLFVVVAVATEWRVYDQIPWLARPSIAIAGSTVVASVAVGDLSTQDYSRYLVLWSVLVAGMIVGSVLTGRTGMPLEVQRVFDSRAVDTWSLAVMAVATVAAAYFFATQGVPALAGNVEQSRVDAAVEGTGYFRLLAYMAGPATVMLFATKHRMRFIALVLTILIITGMANRSPYLYLLVPLVFVVTTRSRLRLSSGRIVGAAVMIGALIIGFGTFRVFSQEEFARYAEYRDAIATNDVVAVAITSLTNYAEVVPRNQVLTSKLVDTGSIPLQWGSTYGTLFISALPGEQLSLDRQIRNASGSTFVGGGTPPTLAGEGYVNFGLAGTFAAGVFVVSLLRYWARRYDRALACSSDNALARGYAAVYGYMLCWVVGAPVAGLAGASTVPLAGAILIVILRARGGGNFK